MQQNPNLWLPSRYTPRFYPLLGILGITCTLWGGVPAVKAQGSATQTLMGQAIPQTFIPQAFIPQTFASQAFISQAFISQAQVLIAQSSSSQQLGQLLRDANKDIQNGNYADAINRYGQASVLDPKNAKIFSGIAFAYSQLGKFAEAAESFRQALALDGRNADLHYGLALCLTQLGSYGEAIEVYRTALGLIPETSRNRSNLYLGLGLAQEKDGNPNAALETYQQLMTLNPKDSQGYAAAAAVLIKQKRFQEALPVVQRAVTLAPNSGTYLNLGIVWLGLGNPQQAVNAFQQAKQINPQDSNVYLTLGKVFQQTGQPQEALEMYRESLRLSPQQVGAYQQIVTMFLEQRDYLRAIVYAKFWKEQFPQDAGAYRSLGLALKGRGYPIDAQSAWESAKQLYRRQGNTAAVQDIETLQRSLN